MALVDLKITRRTFLTTGTAVGIAGLAPSYALAAENGDTPWYRRGKIETTYNYCDMCPWRCGIVVRSVDGVVQKVDGNPLDPKSRGMLCARGQGGVSFLNDPDRLQAPMLRAGARGEGRTS